MRKRILLLVMVAVVILLGGESSVVFAADEVITEDKLYGEIDVILDGMDLSALEKYASEISTLLNGQTDFKTLLVDFIRGEGVAEYDDAVNYLLGLLFGGIKSKLPVFVSLLALLIFCSLMVGIAPEKSNGMREVCEFIALAVVVTTVATVSVSVIYSARDACINVSKLMQISFPFLLALTTASGGAAQAAVYSPTALFIDNFVSVYVCEVMFPMLVAMLAVTVVSNISKRVKFKGFIDFLSSFMKWTIGLIGVVFSIFLTVKGLNAGAFDGVSVKTLKYALSSSVPIVGGVLGGGADVVLAAVALTKNALGTLSVVLVFGVVILPIIEISSLIFALRLVNAVAQPLSGDSTYSFINSCVSVLNHAFAGVVLVALTYTATVLVMLLSGQGFV